MATLQAVLKDVQGIGRDEQMRLATFLEQNKLRGARAMEKLIHGPGGVVVGGSIAAIELQDDLSESGKKMIDEITELMKDSVGKNASETRDILTKMQVINETLEKSTSEEAKKIQQLMKPGLAAMEAQGSLGNVFADVVRGRVANFGQRMVGKIPLVGGVLSDVMQTSRRRKQLAAEQRMKIGGFAGDTVEETLEKIKENTTITADAETSKEKKSKSEEAEEASEEKRGMKSKVLAMLGMGGKKGDKAIGAGVLGFLKNLPIIGAIAGVIGGGVSAIVGAIMPVVVGILGSPVLLAAAAAAVGVLAIMNAEKIVQKIRDIIGIDARQKDEEDASNLATGKAGQVQGTEGESFDRAFKVEGGQKALMRNVDTGEIKAMTRREIAADEAGAFQFAPVTDPTLAGRSTAFREGKDLEALRGGGLSEAEGMEAVSKAQFKQGGREQAFRKLLLEAIDVDRAFKQMYIGDYIDGDKGAAEWNVAGQFWAGRFNQLSTGIAMMQRIGAGKDPSKGISRLQADVLYGAFPWISRDGMAKFKQPFFMESYGDLQIPGSGFDFEGGNWTREELFELSPKKDNEEIDRLLKRGRQRGPRRQRGPSNQGAASISGGGGLVMHEGGMINPRGNYSATLAPSEIVLPLSKVLSEGSGIIPEPIKSLLNMVTGNALVKGTPAMAGSMGGNIIAPTNTVVNTKTENNTFTGGSIRNQDSTLIEANRRTYS